MAIVVVLILVLTAIAFGVLVGGVLMISLTIRRDEQSPGGSLRFDAPARSARTLVGLSASRRD